MVRQTLGESSSLFSISVKSPPFSNFLCTSVTFLHPPHHVPGSISSIMAYVANALANAASRPKQKHVTTACLNCRTRNIKCDAGTPSCSNCTLYAQQCKYQHGQDKRKIPVKERLAVTEAYVKRLESLLIANEISLPNSNGALIRNQLKN